MTNTVRQLLVFSVSFLSVVLSGCALLPGGQVTEATTIVYTAGSKKHTAAVQIPAAASEVYATFDRLLADRPDVNLDNRNDKAYLMEVSKGGRSLTGQVTSLGPDRSLLYVWADAGDTGVSGEDLATSVVEIICDELGVEYELVNY
jgi:hypothetical protein